MTGSASAARTYPAQWRVQNAARLPLVGKPPAAWRRERDGADS